MLFIFQSTKQSYLSCEVTFLHQHTNEEWFYPFNNKLFFKSQVISISKNLHNYHSYAFETPETEIHDLNTFLLISLIFHLEIHTFVETKGDPNDFLSTLLSSGQSSDP